VRFSLLAVGDQGASPDDAEGLRTQLRVGRALAAHDRERPADALVLLGDNFYPMGLRAGEVRERVAANVVRPYCRFVDLSAPRSAEVADACPRPPEERRPVPILAVLGNHDHLAPESPTLQRRAVPQYVANWRAGGRRAELVEMDAGVSLVLVDSDPIYRGADAGPLYRALRRARGSWRIVVAHHPMPVLGAWDPELRREYRGYRLRMLLAVSGARRGVPLVLSGHEHSLQLHVMHPPAPALHAVAGSGSETRKLREDNPRRRAAASAPGYARVDLAGPDGAERLHVSLYRVPPAPLDRWIPRWLVARWSVDAAGEPRKETGDVLNLLTFWKAE